MKKIYITICLFVGLISFSKAQGNLQFNKAKFIELAGLTSGSGIGMGMCDSTSITIPENKTWKIEHFEAFPYDTSYNNLPPNPDNYSTYIGYILINDVALSYHSSPIWLPAGKYKIKLSGKLYAGKVYYKAFISAIEYNIVP